MRLDELTKPDNFDQAITYLMSKGYSVLGKGSYAKVLISPKHDYVLKIFDSYDTGYWKFLEFVANNHSQYLPNVIGKPLKINAEYSAVRLEKLATNSKSQLISSMIKKYYLNKATANHLFYAYPGFTNLLDKLSAFRNENNLLMDLHSDNIMFSGEIPIIIDPFVGIHRGI